MFLRVETSVIGLLCCRSAQAPVTCSRALGAGERGDGRKSEEDPEAVRRFVSAKSDEIRAGSFSEIFSAKVLQG